MSLLDDVSLMITPNGVSRNVLFGVLPTPTFSYEKIDLTSGATSEPSEWGSITTNGIKKLTSSATTYYETGFTVTTGKTYEASFTLSDYSGSSTMGFSNQGGVPSSIRLSGNGSVSGYFTATANAQLQLYGLSTNTGTFSNVSVKEVTTSDMDFTRATSATRVNPSGLVDGITTGLPRLDYRVSESCPHILVESQRTNLLDDSNAAASLREVTLTNTTSPDGTANALKLTETTANDQHFATISEATVSSGSVYTMSIFIKKGTQSSVRIYTQSSKINSDITVDLDAGSVAVAGADVVTGSGTISNYGNGWYRVAWGGTCSGSGAMSIYATVKDLTTYTGSTSEYTEYFGGQVELGSYATSYIPTSGSTVTRNGEVFERTGIADLIGTAGVLYLEAASAGTGIQQTIALSAGTTGNRVIFYYTASGNIAFQLKVGGSAVASGSVTGMTQTDFHKFAIRYQDDSFQLFIDGVKKKDVAGTFTIPVFDRLLFDNGAGAGASAFYGKIRNLQLYKTALTEAKCISLTT